MHGYGWMWPMGGMMVGWLLLTVLLVAFVVWLVSSSSGPRSSTPDEAGPARRILAERYARGEMDTEEYNRRMATLR
ncbi:MAG TPA: SHOCT domain-containing protein [Micromonosporaceae bacterium]|nr:SHOCT domain-containing protein [Micromonosporaceae bacterium]